MCRTPDETLCWNPSPTSLTRRPPGKPKTMLVSRVNQNLKELQPQLYLSSQAVQTIIHDRVQRKHLTKSKSTVLTNGRMCNWLLWLLYHPSLSVICHFLPLPIVCHSLYIIICNFPLSVIAHWLSLPIVLHTHCLLFPIVCSSTLFAVPHCHSLSGIPHLLSFTILSTSNRIPTRGQ